MLRFLGNEKGFDFKPNAVILFSPPSFGNAGQLAGDLILSTMNRRKRLTYVGSIESVLLLPTSGYESLNSSSSLGTKLILPIEVYEIANDSSSPIYIIQQRSQCVKGAIELFYNQFKSFLASIHVLLLIVLTGGGTEDMELGEYRNFSLQNEVAKALIPTLYPR